MVIFVQPLAMVCPWQQIWNYLKGTCEGSCIELIYINLC